MKRSRADAWRRGRTLMYAVAFPCLFWLDSVTPIGVADWLLYVILVSIAAMWGSKRELRIVLVIACALLAVGVLTSPLTIAPLWMGGLNRGLGLVVVWSLAHMADRRRLAEERERKAAAETRILQGLLPMCAACKSIRDGAGEWHQLETYLSAHSEARLSHSWCPRCAAKLMDELERVEGINRRQ